MHHASEFLGITRRFSDPNADDGEEENEEPDLSAIHKAIGVVEKYQVYIWIVLFISKFPMAYHQMSIIFLASPVTYVCKSTNITNGCPCSDPIYDRSIFEKTIITEWDLICEKIFLQELAQMSVMLGILVGSIIFGALSDRFGRRLPLFYAVVLQLISVIVTSQAPEFWSFAAFRFMIGVATGGTMVISFVITMEFVSLEYRENAAAFYQLPYNFGMLTLVLFRYYLRDLSYFQLVLSIPTVLMLSYYWLVPESPCWLLAVGRTEQAIAVLVKAAKRNNLPHKYIARDIRFYQRTKPETEMQERTLLDLFRTPNIRKNTSFMGLTWLVCGFEFFGTSQYIGQLAGDIFLNISLMAVITIPLGFLSIALMKIMGRKTLIVISFVLTSICLILMAFINHDLAKVILTCIGNVCMFISFIVLYLSASEMFPTVVRNAGVGFCSMLARLGSIIAPTVLDLRTQGDWIPPLIFAIASLLGAIFCLFVPETKGCALMDTINEGEMFGEKNPKRESYT